MHPRRVAAKHPLTALVVTLLIAGCGSSPSTNNGAGTGTNGLVPGGASAVYLFQPGSSTTPTAFTVYNLLSNGTATPTSTFTVSAANFIGMSWAIDPTSGTVYIGGIINGSAIPEVLAFPAGSSGTVSPSRIITAGTAGYGDNFGGAPISLTVDAKGQLYIYSVPYNLAHQGINTITVYSPTATGLATPILLIPGAGPGSITGQIKVDTPGNIYINSLSEDVVVNGQYTFPGYITVYPPVGSSSSAPLRTISDGVNWYNTFALDPNQNIYVVETTYTGINATASNQQIAEFAAGASGAPTPIKTISGAATGFGLIAGMTLDNENNMYVSNEDGSTTSSPTYSLMGFPPTATGNVAPSVIWQGLLAFP